MLDVDRIERAETYVYALIENLKQDLKGSLAKKLEEDESLRDLLISVYLDGNTFSIPGAGDTAASILLSQRVLQLQSEVGMLRDENAKLQRKADTVDAVISKAMEINRASEAILRMTKDETYEWVDRSTG